LERFAAVAQYHPLSRRALLRAGVLGGVGVALGRLPGARAAGGARIGVPNGWDYPTALPLPFGHGVASGDPCLTASCCGRG
jgi:hypothetical protein